MGGRKARQMQSDGVAGGRSVVRLTFWGLKIILYFLLLPDILSALTISADKNHTGRAQAALPPEPSRLLQPQGTSQDPKHLRQREEIPGGQPSCTDSPSQALLAEAAQSSGPAHGMQEAPHEEPQPEPRRGAGCHPSAAGDGQPAPIHWHSPAMNLMVLMRGRTRKQNLCARGARAPRARPFPAPLSQQPRPGPASRDRRPPPTSSAPSPGWPGRPAARRRALTGRWRRGPAGSPLCTACPRRAAAGRGRGWAGSGQGAAGTPGPGPGGTFRMETLAMRSRGLIRSASMNRSFFPGSCGQAGRGAGDTPAAARPSFSLPCRYRAPPGRHRAPAHAGMTPIPPPRQPPAPVRDPSAPAALPGLARPRHPPRSRPGWCPPDAAVCRTCSSR